MSKTRRSVGGHRRKSAPVRISHKIGNRKSHISAVLLSTADLLGRLPKAGRDRTMIERVLRHRGVTDFVLLPPLTEEQFEAGRA